MEVVDMVDNSFNKSESKNRLSKYNHLVHNSGQLNANIYNNPLMGVQSVGKISLRKAQAPSYAYTTDKSKIVSSMSSAQLKDKNISANPGSSASTSKRVSRHRTSKSVSAVGTLDPAKFTKRESMSSRDSTGMNMHFPERSLSSKTKTEHSSLERKHSRKNGPSSSGTSTNRGTELSAGNSFSTVRHSTKSKSVNSKSVVSTPRTSKTDDSEDYDEITESLRDAIPAEFIDFDNSSIFESILESEMTSVRSMKLNDRKSAQEKLRKEKQSQKEKIQREKQIQRGKLLQEKQLQREKLQKEKQIYMEKQLQKERIHKEKVKREKLLQKKRVLQKEKSSQKERLLQNEKSLQREKSIEKEKLQRGKIPRIHGAGLKISPNIQRNSLYAQSQAQAQSHKIKRKSTIEDYDAFIKLAANSEKKSAKVAAEINDFEEPPEPLIEKTPKGSPTRLRPPSITVKRNSRLTGSSTFNTFNTFSTTPSNTLSANGISMINSSNTANTTIITRTPTSANKGKRLSSSKSFIPISTSLKQRDSLYNIRSDSMVSIDDDLAFLKDFSFDNEENAIVDDFTTGLLGSPATPKAEKLSKSKDDHEGGEDYGDGDVTITVSEKDAKSIIEDSDFEADPSIELLDSLNAGSRRSGLGGETNTLPESINNDVNHVEGKQQGSAEVGTQNQIASKFYNGSTFKNFTIASADNVNDCKTCLPPSDKKLFESSFRLKNLRHTKERDTGSQKSVDSRKAAAVKKSSTLNNVNVTSKYLMKAVKNKYGHAHSQKSDGSQKKLMGSFKRQKKQIRNRDEMLVALKSFEETNVILQQLEATPNHAVPVMKAGEILSDKSYNLSLYEKSELSRKANVYYMKLQDELPTEVNHKKNFGYDDDDKNYIAKVGNHIDYRYEILQVLGNGSFGNVLKCCDHKNNKIVAIKVIKNDMQWSLQAVYEIKILKNLSKSRSDSKENYTLKYKNHFSFRSHMCIVSELLSVNLFQVVQASGFSGVSMNILMKWGFQMLKALEFIHGNDVIHCDMKPENIMLISPTSLDIKIIDFGSACYTGETSYTYIQSRFYRAPEVLIGARYSMPIDIWSTGCILYELLTGEPLFPSKDEPEHLAMNVEVLGLPSNKGILKLRKELIDKGPIDKVDENVEPYTMIDLNFDANGFMKPNFVKLKKIVPFSKPLSKLIPESHELQPLFVQFLTNCLEWDSFKRKSASELLQDSWLIYYQQNKDAIERTVGGTTW